MLNSRQQIELVKKILDENVHNYFLTFTGYSFGALLAELSLILCKKQEPLMNIRCTTFDSPGSFEFFAFICNLTETNDNLVELIYSLDMVTYISSPNYFNSYDEHIGLIKYLYLNENELDIFVNESNELDSKNIKEFKLNSLASLTNVNLDKIDKKIKNKEIKIAHLNEYHKSKEVILNSFVDQVQNKLKLLGPDEFACMTIYAKLLNGIVERLKYNHDEGTFLNKRYCRFGLEEINEFDKIINSYQYHDINYLLIKLNKDNLDHIDKLIHRDSTGSNLLSEQFKLIKCLFKIDNKMIMKSIGEKSTLVSIDRIKRRFERLIDIQKIISNFNETAVAANDKITKKNNGIYHLFYY
jgi:hypothetical protein